MNAGAWRHDPLCAGFVIHRVRESGDFRTLEIDGSVSLEEQKTCPACVVPLTTLMTLVGNGGKRRIRVGSCNSCGYVGYMDRPTKAWMVSFYENTWDNAETRGLADTIRKSRASRNLALKSGRKSVAADVQRTAAHMADGLGIDKKRPICDVGCGNGVVLSEFAAMGFTNLCGVENSRFRSELAHALYGYPVYTGAVEEAAVRKELIRMAPIGLFFSFHVVEHIYYPEAAFETFGALQNAGDHIIIATPQFIEETPGTVVFWMPHLHTFTPVTMRRLFNRAGYEVVKENVEHYDSMVMVGKKVDRIPEAYASGGGGNAIAADRIGDFFFSRDLKKGKRYAFGLRKRKGAPDHYPFVHVIPRSAALDALLYKVDRVRRMLLARLLKRFVKQYSFAVSSLEYRATRSEESPFEIQFTGNIILFLR